MSTLPSLAVTSVFVGLFALAFVPLTMAVGLRRAQTGIPFLDGGDATLLRRIRAQGNFVENVPLALLAMAAAEWQGLPGAWLWAGGACLLASRALHAYWTLRHGWGTPRASGMLLGFLPLLGFGAWALWRGLGT